MYKTQSEQHLRSILRVFYVYFTSIIPVIFSPVLVGYSMYISYNIKKEAMFIIGIILFVVFAIWFVIHFGVPSIAAIVVFTVMYAGFGASMVWSVIAGIVTFLVAAKNPDQW